MWYTYSMPNTKVQYSGEYIDCEAAEERPFCVNTIAEITRMIRQMKDGDAIVINMSEEFDN